jgi:hypothetical protein
MSNETQPQTVEATDTSSAVSSEEQHVRRVLESARQTVKPVVKREMEGEAVREDVVNLRFKKTLNDSEC